MILYCKYNKIDDIISTINLIQEVDYKWLKNYKRKIEVQF